MVFVAVLVKIYGVISYEKNVSSILQLFRKAAVVILLSDHTPPHRGTTRPSVPSRIEFQIVAVEPLV